MKRIGVAGPWYARRIALFRTDGRPRLDSREIALACQPNPDASVSHRPAFNLPDPSGRQIELWTQRLERMVGPGIDPRTRPSHLRSRGDLASSASSIVTGIESMRSEFRGEENLE
jgi:hypothetical protein